MEESDQYFENFQWNCCIDSCEIFLDIFLNPLKSWMGTLEGNAGGISEEIYGGMQLMQQSLHEFL